MIKTYLNRNKKTLKVNIYIVADFENLTYKIGQDEEPKQRDFINGTMQDIKAILKSLSILGFKQVK